MRSALLAVVVALVCNGCSPPRTCTLAVDGHPELRTCSDGAVERVGERVCPATETCPTFSIDACTRDDECASAASDTAESAFCRNGRCTCDECDRDDDCAADSICRCEGADFSSPKQGPGTRCFASCRTSAECNRDELCIETPFGSFACQAATSPCHVDDDCWFAHERCRPTSASSDWTCAPVFPD